MAEDFKLAEINGTFSDSAPLDETSTDIEIFHRFGLELKKPASYECIKTIVPNLIRQYKNGPQLMAVKKINYKTTGRELLINDHLVKRQQELAGLAQLKYVNIMHTHWTFVSVDEHYVFMATGWYDCTLHDYINSQEEVGRRDYKSILRYIARGVKELHDLHIMHRDLKPQNILINRNTGVAVLTDFGLSRLRNLKHEQTGSWAYTFFVCSGWYGSPSVRLGNGQYNTSIDIWALGMMMLDMVYPNARANMEKTVRCRFAAETRTMDGNVFNLVSLPPPSHSFAVSRQKQLTPATAIFRIMTRTPTMGL